MSADAAIALTNTLASVSIILCNKQIATGLRFDFLLTTLCMNFFSTSTVCSAMVQLGYVQVKHLPGWDRWLVAGLAVGTVLFNNASVEANSVGFYQIMKLLIIPTVIMIERAQGNKRTYSRQIVMSLILSTVGVAMATVTDFEVNFRGSVVAMISTLATAQFQLWQSGKQSEHGLSTMQIQHSAGWPQTLIGVTGALTLDVLFPSMKGWLFLRPNSLLDYDLDKVGGISRLGFWQGVCCSLAVVMNLSTYALLGRVSPVTYQVIGQVKTVFIVVLGLVFFDTFTWSAQLVFRLLGVAVAVSGSFRYGILKTREQNAKKNDDKKNDDKKK